MGNLRFLYEDRLVEESVLKEIEMRSRSGDRSAYTLYHEMSDDLYSLTHGPDRLEGFRKLHLYFFTRLGLKDALESSLQAFPRIREKVGTVIVRPALKKEFADLSESAQGLTLILELSSATLADRKILGALLRRELTLVNDMLDPAFQYSRALPPRLTPSQENLFRDRYGFLWRLYVDARLVRAGLESPDAKERRRAQFKEMFPSVKPDAADRAFDILWERPTYTHPDLRDMAADLSKLLAVAWTEAQAAENPTYPGGPCPLCRFPTHHWASLNGTAERVAREIQKDFPEWQPTHGLCDRCCELYSLRS